MIIMLIPSCIHFYLIVVFVMWSIVAFTFLYMLLFAWVFQHVFCYKFYMYKSKFQIVIIGYFTYSFIQYCSHCLIFYIIIHHLNPSLVIPCHLLMILTLHLLFLKLCTYLLTPYVILYLITLIIYTFVVIVHFL